MADDFLLADPAAQPFDFGSVQTPPFVSPTIPPPQQTRGIAHNPQDRMQAMKLAIMLPLAMKAGPGAVQGLLQGFAKHGETQDTTDRQARQDASLDAQRQATQQYQQQQAQNAHLGQQRQFLHDFTGGLGSLDSPEAIDAYMTLYAKQGQAFGVTPDQLSQYAAPYKEPSRLQQKAVESYVKSLKSLYGDKWEERAQQFTHTVKGFDHPLTFDELMGAQGQTRDPNAPKAAPADKRGYQRVDANVNGKHVFVNFDPDTGKYYDPQTNAEVPNVAPYDKPAGNILGDPSTVADAEAIADAIAAGRQPPTTTGLYGKTAAVRAALEKRGYNLTNASLDYDATRAHLRTLNGAQQTRMRQAVDNAAHSLDVIEDLARQWDGGKFPLLNRGRLAAAKQGGLGPAAQTLATQLEAQIADVTSELGNVYMGGNSPTDHALTLAQKNLQANWTKQQLLDAIKLARTNLQIRQNSISNAGAVTYTGQDMTPAPSHVVTPPGSNPFRRTP